MIVDLDLIGWEPGHVRGGSLRACHHLDTDPNIATVIGEMDRAIHRPRGGMGEDGHLLDGVYFPRDPFYPLGEVAVARSDAAFFLRGARHLLYNALRRDVRVRPGVPWDAERGNRQ